MADDDKFPSQLAERFQVRMPDGMRQEIAREAEANNRSMNAEIISRLRRSLDTDNSLIPEGRSRWANEKKSPEDAKYILYEIQRQAIENLSVTESLIKALGRLGVEVYAPERAKEELAEADRDPPSNRESAEDKR